MAVSPTNTGSIATTSPGGEKSYHAALSVVTTLFFIWGSLTSLNDVLIPYAQHAFTLSLAESMLIQTAFFAAYFVFSLPASWIITWIGYKKAIIVIATMMGRKVFWYSSLSNKIHCDVVLEKSKKNKNFAIRDINHRKLFNFVGVQGYRSILLDTVLKVG